jgi:hypothetical protein
MPAFRIAVCPMDDAALGVPFVLASKLDGVADSQISRSVGQVDVVRHQQFLPRGQPEDEFLVPNAIVIIREDSGDLTNPLNRNIPEAILERRCQDLIGIADGTGNIALLRWFAAVLKTAKVNDGKQNN